MRAHHGEQQQSDGTGPEDGHGPARHVAGESYGVHGGGQRFDEGGGEVVEIVRYRVQPVGGDGEEVGHAALFPAAAEELQVLAQVGAVGRAHLAPPARQGRLDGHPLAGYDGGDQVAGGFHDADHLVSRVIGEGDERVPTVDGVRVGAADAGDAHPDEGVARAGFRAFDGLDRHPVEVDDDSTHGLRGVMG